MATSRSRVLWALAGTSILLFGGAAALLPRWIDTPAVRARLVAEASRALGAEVRVEAIGLSLFPPRFVLARPSVAAPQGISLEAEAVTAVPEVLPLLRGELRLASLRMVTPRVTLPLPDVPGREAESARAPFGALAGHLGTLTAAVTAPRALVTVAGGELVLTRRGLPDLRLQEVHARVEGGEKRTRVELTCRTDAVEEISLEGWVEPDTLAGAGQLTFTDATLGPLLAPLAPGRLALGETRDDVSLTWEAEDAQHVEARWQIRLTPLDLGLASGHGRTDASLEGALRLSPARVGLAVDRFHLDEPPLQGSAEATWDLPGNAVRVALRCPDLAVEPVREAALQLLGERRWVQTLFAILRGGRVANLEVASAAPGWPGLALLENLEISGDLQEGTVHAPAVDRVVAGARGTVRLSGGTLQASALGGTTGGSSVADGTLLVGLRGAGAPFHLELELDADLAELPDVLRKTVRHPGFLDHLAAVQDLRGRARGRLVVGERFGELRVSAKVREVAAAGRHAAVPLPLELSSGQLSLGPTQLEARNLSGRVGGSAFRETAGVIRWDGPPHLALWSATGTANLGELYPWLSPPLLGAGARGLEEVRGTAVVERLALGGPATEPARWEVDLRARLSEGSALAPALGRVDIRSAEVAASAEALAFSGAQARLADAGLTLEGEWRFRDSAASLRVSGQGEVGPEAFRLLQGALPLPEPLRLRGPLRLADGALRWDRTGTVAFSGTLATAATELEVDVLGDRQVFALRKLALRDGASDSRATLSGSRQGADLAAKFHGRLEGAALDRLLARPGLLRGALSGQVELRAPTDRPGATTGQGHLELRGLELAGGLPWVVEAASLRFAGSELRADPARIRVGETAVELRGTARLSPAGWDLDVEASSPLLDGNALRSLLAQAPSGETAPGGVRALGLPVLGSVRVAAESLLYAGFTWSPLEARVQLRPTGLGAEVTRAELCGVATPGALSLEPGAIHLEHRLDARDLPLAPALACLWGVEGVITGTASLGAQVSSEGAPGELLAHSRGEFRVEAARGRVHRYGALARVFALLNVTEVFRGRLPDLAGEGLRYEAIRAQGEVRDGVLEFREGVMDASSLTLFWHGTWDLNRDVLDLTVLVAPFKTADAVVRRLPLIGYVLGDSLVAVPVRVTGPRTDPQVVPLEPTAVGAGLLGVVKRTLSLPLRVIQPLLGESAP